MKIPESLDWWRGEPGGPMWLARLPRLVEECALRWELRVGAPIEPSHVSLVVAVDLPEGTPAVLKLNFPDPESEREADALAHWNGDGSVRLLAQDHERRALLVELCEPGSTLWELPDRRSRTASPRVFSGGSGALLRKTISFASSRTRRRVGRQSCRSAGSATGGPTTTLFWTKLPASSARRGRRRASRSSCTRTSTAATCFGRPGSRG